MNTDGIIYVPQYCTYRIKVGGRIVEVDARTLEQAHSIEMVEAVLRDGSDRFKNDFLDYIIKLGGKLIGDHQDNDDKYRDIYMKSIQDPTDALYRGSMGPRDNVVACTDTPKLTPDYDPSAAPKVYYNDRFPSKRSADIIDEAIELLNAKKNLHMAKISIESVFEGFRLRAHSDMPASMGTSKTLIVLIKRMAFDRAHKTDIDDSARLMAKLDTNTYIKLRIAFLLYEALKTCEYNKQSMDSDIFEILYSDQKDETCFKTNFK